MKRTALLLLILIFLFVLPAFSFAQVIQTDRSISATMHIDPNNEPFAHSPSILSFEFKDQQNRFRGEICNCMFTIKKEGQTIYAQQLFHTNASSHLIQSTVQYTFPSLGTYQIIITGTPQTRSTFQAFTLSYDVHVSKDANQPVTIKKPVTENMTFEKRIIDFIVAVLGIGSILLLIGALRSIKHEQV